MANIKKIQQAMKAQGIEALLLSNEMDRLYATDYFATDGTVLILSDQAYCIVDSRYIEAAQAQVHDAQVILTTKDNSPTDIMKQLLTQKGITKVGTQEERMSYGEYLRTGEKLGVSLFGAQALTDTLREVKERSEVDSIVAAQRIAEKALDHVLGIIQPGMTEKELAAELEYHMAKNGAQGLAFETICVAGANTSLPHGVPSLSKLKAGDFITMDFGCRINGYCSDMTRTVALGSASEEMRKVYDVVYRAQVAACDAAIAGIVGKELDMVARSIIENAGYGQYFGHSLGHSVGLFIHEAPNASPKEERRLPAGAVITSEPGIYLPGKFGVRIEDMLYLTETGAENLTKAPKNLIIV